MLVRLGANELVSLEWAEELVDAFDECRNGLDRRGETFATEGCCNV